MPRKPEPEHPDDLDVQLAAPVTPDQRTELARLGYRGPTPSTSDQAAAIIRQRTQPSAPEETPR